MVRTRRYEVNVNYSGYASLQEDIRRGLVDTTDRPGNPYSVALRRWGEIYRTYLKQRFNRLKPGGGSWDKIGESTKKWRKYRHGITHEQILYVTRALYSTTNKKYKTAPGQYERRTKYGISLGVSRERHSDSGMSFHRLVKLHASGKIPSKKTNTLRVIYKVADEATKAKMHASMSRAHQQAVNEANKQVRSIPSS